MKPICKDQNKCLFLQIHVHQYNTTWKNQGTMTSPKETNKVLINDPKEMMIYRLPDKEYKIIIIKKVNEMRENTDF